MKAISQNMPQASSGGGALARNGGVLGQIAGAYLGAQAKAQDVAVQEHLMTFQHGLGIQRDSHQAGLRVAVDQASQATNAHYKLAHEKTLTGELDTRGTRQNELNKDLDTHKTTNINNKNSVKGDIDIKVSQKTEAAKRSTVRGNLKSGLDAKIRETNELYKNSQDPSTGTSPIIGQNYGNQLGAHLAAHAAGYNKKQLPTPTPKPKPKPTPKPAPIIPAASSDPATPKKRNRKTATTGGGLTEINNSNVATGTRGA